MLDQEDEGTRIGVWVTLGVVFFVLVGVVGGVVMRETRQMAAARAKPAADAIKMIDAPLVGELLGKLYFESGQSALPADGAARIDAAAKALAARVPLRKPESTTGDGSLAEARRVEIRLVD